MTQPIDDGLARTLLLRCAQKEERALVELHGLLARRIYAFAYHRLRDEVTAETVVVDTLFEVWNSAAKFRGESRVSTWVLGIARYKLMGLWRQTAQGHEDIDDYADTLASELDDGEQSLSRWQQEQIVHRCMNTLTAAHRECMQLVYFDGMGLAEVASVQQIPENTVKTRLFHARKIMRACVEKSGGLPS